MKELVAGLNKAKTGMETASQGMDSAAAGMNQAAAGMNSAADTIRTASSGISQAASQLQGVSAPVSKAADSMAGVVQQCAQDANAQIEAANGQISAANQQTEAANAVITNASAALQAIQGQADENGMISAESLSAVIGSLAGADAGVSGVSGIDADAYTGQAQQIAASAAEQIAGAQSTLNSTASQLEQAASGLNSGADTLGNKAGEMSSGASQMQAGANEMEEGISSMPEVPSDPINVVSAAVDQLCAGSQKVNAGTTSVASALSTLESGTKNFPKAAAGVKALNAGFETLTANDETLTSGAASLKAVGSSVTGGINQLTNGGKTLADGINTLSAGLNTYTDGVSTLAENNSVLTGGTSQLAEGAKTLASGAEQLASGTKTLHDGTSKLVSNNNKLNRGAEQLSDGAGQIQDGSSQLYDGSKELGDGMTKLEDGSDTLATSLGDGAAQVKETKASDDTISMFATPITDEETKITTVENNGHAMAPYMMSVGLWVGCLAFCLMYPLTEYKGKLKSGFAWWASKASVLYPVAILQGVLLILLLHVFDGFTPVEMTKTILFAALTGACFTSIMYFFNITFGKVGSFLMLIFMVVQLAGSAGTYPIEMTPAFFQRLHPLLPFTYGINAMREAIAGMYGHEYMKNLLCLALYLPIAFLIGLGFRKLLMNLNYLFDKKLAETDLMICETEAVNQEKTQVSLVIKALMGEETLREELVAKAAAFEAGYQKQIRIGFAAMIILPVIFLILMFSIESKIVFLVLWIASIIVIAVYLIILEYIHERLKRETELGALSREELLNAMKGRDDE